MNVQLGKPLKTIKTYKCDECWLQVLGADGLLYQSVEDLLSVAQSLNPNIQNFEASCFTGRPSLAY